MGPSDQSGNIGIEGLLGDETIKSCMYLDGIDPVGGPIAGASLPFPVIVCNGCKEGFFIADASPSEED